MHRYQKLLAVSNPQSNHQHLVTLVPTVSVPMVHETGTIGCMGCRPVPEFPSAIPNPHGDHQHHGP
jgi:hypothetical protein